VTIRLVTAEPSKHKQRLLILAKESNALFIGNCYQIMRELKNGKSNSSTRKELLLIKVALLFIGLSLCIVGKKIDTWPIVTWPMYSSDTVEFPPTRAAVVQLRVTSGRGDLYTLAPWDLFPMERAVVAERVIEHAFDDSDGPLRNAHRAYLVNLVKRRLSNAEVKTIQGWRLHWDVDPLRLPPLERNHPLQEVLLGSFAASLYEEIPEAEQ
jgi:hypothetical protein